MSKNNHSDICVQCGALCCKAVKRIPFLGETAPELYGSVLTGAFPDTEPVADHRRRGFRRPFVVEWVIPGEASSCPCLTDSGLCGIYGSRPFACRKFPLTEKSGPHPFCRFSEHVNGERVPQSPVMAAQAMLDALILSMLVSDDRNGASRLLREDDPMRPPMLYNGYLAAIWIITGVRISECIEGQKRVLDRYRNKGFGELTFLVPDTGLEITCGIEGLHANIDWLEWRIANEDMEQGIRRSLEEAGIGLNLPCSGDRR